MSGIISSRKNIVRNVSVRESNLGLRWRENVLRIMWWRKRGRSFPMICFGGDQPVGWPVRPAAETDYYVEGDGGGRRSVMLTCK